MRRTLLTLALGLAAFRLAADATTPVSIVPAPTPKPLPFATIKGVETDRSIIVTQAEFAGWPHISLAEAQRLLAMKSVVFADARAKVEWDQGHIPGALPVPLGEFDAYYKKNESKFKKAKYIVAYCHGVGCHLSDMACKNFVAKGHHNVVNFYGGWPAWTGAKLATQDLAGKITTPAPETSTAAAGVPSPSLSPGPVRPQ